jgi:hypothetical protein
MTPAHPAVVAVVVVVVAVAVVAVAVVAVVVMTAKPSGHFPLIVSVQKPNWLAMQIPDPTLQNNASTVGVSIPSLLLLLALLPDPDDSVDGNEPSPPHAMNCSGHSLVVALTYPAHTSRAGW